MAGGGQAAFEDGQTIPGNGRGTAPATLAPDQGGAQAEAPRFFPASHTRHSRGTAAREGGARRRPALRGRRAIPLNPAERHMATTPDTSDSRRGRNRLRPFTWGTAAVLLLLPAVAMQLGAPGVDWSAGDFVAMGVLLAAACGLYELATWLSGDIAYRAGFGLAVVAGFLTIWVNLAVGMFGSEDNPLNLLFGGVLLVAATGALLAGFRARGMAWAMGATAAAQLLACAVGVAVGLTLGSDEPLGPKLALEGFLTACFALPWLASSQLFRVAARAR